MPQDPEERQSALFRGVDLVRKFAIPTVALASLGGLAETGYDGGFIKDIWSGLKTASPTLAMILFVLYWDEKKERRASNDRLYQRTIAFVEATNLASEAFNRIAASFAAKRKGR